MSRSSTEMVTVVSPRFLAIAYPALNAWTGSRRQIRSNMFCLSLELPWIFLLLRISLSRSPATSSGSSQAVELVVFDGCRDIVEQRLGDSVFPRRYRQLDQLHGAAEAASPGPLAADLGAHDGECFLLLSGGQRFFRQNICIGGLSEPRRCAIEAGG